MNRLRPYLTTFRIRALLETQYRGAALGGLITQMFFGLVYVCLYTALYAGSDPEGLRHTVTYVWLQQMFFRTLFTHDDEMYNAIMSGSLAYTLCRPVDQHLYWLSRQLAFATVGGLMRALPMVAVQLFLPGSVRMSLPASPVAFLQFLVSLALGILCVAQIHAIIVALVMKTLDRRGVSAMLSLLMMTFSGNVVPLTLFPDSLQTLIRYQPFAQALDAPIRLYMGDAASWPISLCAQVGWLAVLFLLSRSLWRRQLRNVTVQGG